jgi:hypothetical protein
MSGHAIVEILKRGHVRRGLGEESAPRREVDLSKVLEPIVRPDIGVIERADWDMRSSIDQTCERPSDHASPQQRIDQEAVE